MRPAYVVLGEAFYIVPAPRLNPEARLDGAYIVRHGDARSGAIVARFKVDGRDKAEAWLNARGAKLFDL